MENDLSSIMMQIQVQDFIYTISRNGDVYKRQSGQPLPESESSDTIVRATWSGFQDQTPEYIKAVSYTHLDVYKRQPIFYILQSIFL